MADGGTFPFGAHQDGVNQVFSVVGVVGTLGTADAGGTARVLPIGVDPATGAAYVYNLGPAGSVTLGNTPGGTLNLVQTLQNGTVVAQGIDSGGTKHILSTDTGGTLNVNAAVSISGGTTNVGTVNTGTINTGTINTGTFVMTSGTLTVLPNLPQGSIQITAGTIGAGTFQKVRAAVGTTGQVSVPGTGAVVLIDANASRKSYIVAHESATGTLYLGFTAASIGVGTGMPLVGNQIFGADDYTGTVFAIMNTGTVKVNYMEV